jgi:peroxiredoxin
MPLFQQAYERHRGAGLVILGISQDAPDRIQAVRDYWTQAGLTFPTLLDPDGTAAKQYQVFVLPSSIFLNAQGVVTAIHQGPLNATQLRQYLEQTMTSQTSAVASDHDATRG